MNLKYLAFNSALFLFFCIIGLKQDNYLVDIQHVITSIPTSRKVVALTFDDGPHNKTTPEILSVLRDKKVKATFFIVGDRVQRWPSLVQQVCAEGHEIGNHSYSHPNMSKLDAARVNEEMLKTEELLTKFAHAPALFRPPGGQYNDTVRKMARDRGYLIILWSIDPEDWKHNPADKITKVVLRNVRPGSIILLHDGINPTSTPEALAKIIDELIERGYEFVTVGDLISYYQENAGP